MNWGPDPTHVDYDIVRKGRNKLLRRAFQNFTDWKALQQFRKENEDWIEDYALFMALKEKNKGRSWTEWKKKLRMRDPETLEKWRGALPGGRGLLRVHPVPVLSSSGTP